MKVVALNFGAMCVFLNQRQTLLTQSFLLFERRPGFLFSPLYFAPVQSRKKTVVIIGGPTAVGKTSVAVAVARYFSAEIISADSRQCYKELSTGVARPSEAELATVPHHFIASHSILQKVTAATFEEYALQKTAELFQQHDTVVMVGGTGLYLKAFAEGMDHIPEVPEALHSEVVFAYKEKGLVWLQRQIESRDPLFYQTGEIQNPQRMMRALEVVKATGKSILYFQKKGKKQRNFNVIKIALEVPKEALHANINARVDKMMCEGLLEEAKRLFLYQDLNALQTVGYKELFAYLGGEMSLPEAVEAIKQNTRRYAKRQLTWFRKDDEHAWLPPDAEKLIQFLSRQKA